MIIFSKNDRSIQKKMITFAAKFLLRLQEEINHLKI